MGNRQKRRDHAADAGKGGGACEGGKDEECKGKGDEGGRQPGAQRQGRCAGQAGPTGKGDEGRRPVAQGGKGSASQPCKHRNCHEAECQGRGQPQPAPGPGACHWATP
jgi:hypothetical protein